MYGGIDQLVDTYKGNPQPLAQKVQKAQQSQPPGAIPPDLEEALALQEITTLRQGAQNQQAMQAGGAQPSVVEKLRQMLGGMQQQAQMAQAPQQPSQGQPVMAARGGSIDQLMSNLGRHYAGGGIVAFVEGGDTMSASSLQDQELASQAAELAAKERKMLELEKRAKELDYLAPASAVKLREQIAAFASGPKPATPTEPNFRRLPDPRSTGTPATAPDVPLTTSAPTAPRPSAGKPNIGGPAAPAAAKLDPNSLRGLTEAYLKGEFAVTPETERDKAVNWTKQTLGLDALLAEKAKRADEREAMIKQTQGERTPAWAEALIAAGKPVRGGLGTLLGQMGNAAQATREGYQAQDLKYQAELAQLRNVITDAKLKGNEEMVKQGTAAYKEVDARRRAAAQSATSLLNTDENTAARIQQANIAAQARRDTARGAGAGAGDRQQLAELKALQTSLQNQLKESPMMMGRAGDDVRRQLAIVNAEIAKMAGISTMATAPGAASPGGTSLKYNPKTGKIE